MLERKILVVFVLAVLIAAAGLWAGPAAPGGEDEDLECARIRIAIRSTVDFNTFTAEGSVRGDLEGTIFFLGDPSSPAPVMGDFLPPLRDALSYTGDLTFTTEKGSITTRNVGVFEPGPFGAGVEFGRVVDGTGKYAGASGVIFFAVESDETGSHSSERGRGTLCFPKRTDFPDDNDDD